MASESKAKPWKYRVTLEVEAESYAAAVEMLMNREARIKELEDQRPTFCSHTAVPWNGHHEESCYTRPPADPPDRTFSGQSEREP